MSVWVNNRHSGITLFKAYNLGPIKNEKPNTTLEKLVLTSSRLLKLTELINYCQPPCYSSYLLICKINAISSDKAIEWNCTANTVTVTCRALTVLSLCDRLLSEKFHLALLSHSSIILSLHNTLTHGLTQHLRKLNSTVIRVCDHSDKA